MKKNISKNIKSGWPVSGLLPVKLYRLLSVFWIKERTFIAIVLTAFVIAAIAFPYPAAAMWVGFLFAAYSATANDSIQTIGTFIASNAHRKWYLLWGYISLIFIITATYSWLAYNGDVSYQRLQTDGLEEAPQSYGFLQIAAPVVLIVLTRLRMPVSTTFLLLSIFSTKASGIASMLEKSAYGYIIAFFSSITIWVLCHGLFKKWQQGKAHGAWHVAQWISSGALWAVWIMQDAANIAVYLPRQLSTGAFIAFIVIFIAGLAVLFFLKGDKIQTIVNEKSSISDVRAATVVDFVYAVILFVFKMMSKIPMSTTWVFIGLLGGRELAIHFMKAGAFQKSIRDILKMICKDIFLALIGLLVSVVLALSISPQLRQAWVDWVSGWMQAG